MSFDFNLWFFIALGVWFAATVFRNVYEVLKYRRSERWARDKFFRIMMVVMSGMWASWGFMCFSDPCKFTSPSWLRWAGAGLFAVGAAGFVLSELHRKRGEGLTTTGIYSIMRHPMYVAQVFLAAGVALFAMGLVTLCMVVLWIMQMVWWAVAEERALEKKYPEYADYRKRTPF
ncbi:isoprenylcysteine carboxylmethyltransferase family protein [candidate division WOR-3 bacterium]|nr:isoprenylcysteine carboxylmethyltransferase family protein [candidate division WOR-3 bacterium]